MHDLVLFVCDSSWETSCILMQVAEKEYFNYVILEYPFDHVIFVSCFGLAGVGVVNI